MVSPSVQGSQLYSLDRKVPLQIMAPIQCIFHFVKFWLEENLILIRHRFLGHLQDAEHLEIKLQNLLKSFVTATSTVVPQLLRGNETRTAVRSESLG